MLLVKYRKYNASVRLVYGGGLTRSYWRSMRAGAINYGLLTIGQIGTVKPPSTLLLIRILNICYRYVS